LISLSLVSCEGKSQLILKKEHRALWIGWWGSVVLLRVPSIGFLNSPHESDRTLLSRLAAAAMVSWNIGIPRMNTTIYNPTDKLYRDNAHQSHVKGKPISNNPPKKVSSITYLGGGRQCLRGAWGKCVGPQWLHGHGADGAGMDLLVQYVVPVQDLVDIVAQRQELLCTPGGQ
jgi:hypothetical protein